MSTAEHDIREPPPVLVDELPPKVTKPRQPTRYEVQRQGREPVDWTVVGVVVAHSALAALREYGEGLPPTDQLGYTLRAIPISRITQVRVNVEQRSTLTFS